MLDDINPGELMKNAIDAMLGQNLTLILTIFRNRILKMLKATTYGSVWWNWCFNSRQKRGQVINYFRTL